MPLAVLEGEIDMANACELRDSLLAAVTNHAPRLVVDLSEISYLDSAGIHVVFELAQRLGARQQQLSLVVPAEAPIRRVLSLTEVASVASVHETRAEAVEQITA